MANTRSAIKRIRQTARQTEVNRRNRSRMRTQVKKLEKALADKDTDAVQQLLNPTLSIVDKSVQKGLLKKNTASRMKSRLTLLTKTLTATAESSSG